MTKIILTYGLIAGVVIILSMLLGFVLMDGGATNPISQLVGYLTMLVALSCIFVGVKRYRDRNLGGVIKFGTALLLGLGISVVAGIAYVVSWEVYLALSDYAFIDEYTAELIRGKTEAGLSGEELVALTAEMDKFKSQYNNLLFRLPMTFLEIFPVGLLVSLISAAILRNPKILPGN